MSRLATPIRKNDNVVVITGKDRGKRGRVLRIDPESGTFTERVDEVQEAVVQCLDCMHDQPHLGFQRGTEASALFVR